MTEITTDTSSKRSLTVLAVVVACFAILWPKIFYPMVISILFPSDEEENQDEIRKLDFHDMLHPQMREAMGEARPLEKPLLKEGNKALFHPSMRYTVKPQSKGAGAVNLVIPVYTIAIILFFIYSLLKTVFKKNQEQCYTFIPNQQKAVCVHKCNEKEDVLNKRKDNSQERKAQRALEHYGKDKEFLISLKVDCCTGIYLLHFKDYLIQTDRFRSRKFAEAIQFSVFIRAKRVGLPQDATYH